MNDRTDEAARLARLLRDIEELERTRAALLNRVESTRSSLLAAGNHTTAIRASVDLLCDHITEIVSAAADFSVVDSEMQEVEQGIKEAGRESSRLAFESDSLLDTLNETDTELERLSSILVERRGKHSRGH